MPIQQLFNPTLVPVCKIFDNYSKKISRKVIYRTLTAIIAAWKKGEDYEPELKTDTLGRPYKIAIGSEEAEFIADLHERSHMSNKMITLHFL